MPWGKRIYIVELRPDDINLGIHLSDTAYELLAVLEFPRPDPAPVWHPISSCLTMAVASTWGASPG